MNSQFRTRLVAQVARVEDCPPNWSIIQRLQEPTTADDEVESTFCSIEADDDVAPNDAGCTVPKPQHTEVVTAVLEEPIAVPENALPTRIQSEVKELSSELASAPAPLEVQQGAMPRTCVEQHPQSTTEHPRLSPATCPSRQGHPQVSMSSVW